jgi:hypothetical protein
MNDDVCKMQHKRVDEVLEQHSEELKDISTKVGTLEKSDATNTVIIQKLCDQLSGLTKAIYSLAVGVGVAILTVILTALLK